MKTLIWKELRENFKWALIAGTCLLGAMFYAIYAKQKSYDDFNINWQTICSSQFLLVTTFAFPIIGAALGAFQIFAEYRPKQWPFVAHLPISRSHIFLSKILAGMGLYCLATLGPLFIVAYWISRPGSIAAPFYWRMTIPGLVGALAGLGFYFATLWVGIQLGRRFGLRVVPFIAAYFIARISIDDLSLVIIEIVIGILPIFFAAWGTFLTFGRFQKQPWWGKISIVVTCLIALSPISGLQFGRTLTPYASYEITPQGQLLQNTYKEDEETKTQLLDGSPGQTDFTPLTTPWPASFNIDQTPSFLSYRGADRLFNPVSDDGNTLWYIDSCQKQLLAYDATSKTLTGRLGPNGFAPPLEAEAAGRFDVHNFFYQERSGYLFTGDAVYKVDLTNQKYRILYHAPPGKKLLGGTAFTEEIAAHDKNSNYSIIKNYFLIAEDQKIELYDEGNEKRLWTYPQPKNLNQFIRISIYPTKIGYSLIYDNSLLLGDTFYARLSLNGKPIKELNLENPLSFDDVFPSKISIKSILFSIRETLLYKATSYFSSHIFLKISGIKDFNGKNGIISILTNVFFSPIGYTAIGMGILCAVIGYRILRKLPLSKIERRAWIVFLIVYGLVGLLVFLMVQDRPRRLRCPTCQKKRSIESATCEHCGAGWPAPALDGTEIFESDLLTAR